MTVSLRGWAHLNSFRDTIGLVNLREAITHELEKLGEGDLKLTLAFVSALASLDRRAKFAELLRQVQELGEMADPVTQRAIEALRTARAIAKMHGITDEDVLEEIRAYRASKPEMGVHPSNKSLGLGQ
jgi:porphobilinogen deaminase